MSQDMGLKPLFLLAGCFIAGGCATPRYTFDDLARDLESQTREIRLDDGVSEREANVIAESYFLRFGPACGVVCDVSDGCQFWVGHTAVGYFGIPTDDPIRIDKQTGRVTWGFGDATIEDPTKMWW